jgi:hypothetical protein
MDGSKNKITKRHWTLPVTGKFLVTTSDIQEKIFVNMYDILRNSRMFLVFEVFRLWAGWKNLTKSTVDSIRMC